MTLNPEIRRATEPLIRFFEANQIQYHMDGSVASSAHGIPRTTIDVDGLSKSEIIQLQQRLLP